jgi:SNF2 family DNA or RNA helicase
MNEATAPGVWRIVGGRLGLIRDGEATFPPANDIYTHFVEKKPVWEDVDMAEIAALRFSRYPMTCRIVLATNADNAKVAGITGTVRERTYPVAEWGVLTAEQVVVDNVWYPLEPQTAKEITAFLDRHHIEPGRPVTLKTYLDLKQQAGGIFTDDTDKPVSALSFFSPGVDTPRGVNATLYPYQLDGWRWLRFLLSEKLGGVLGDEMGLGKTLQVIGAIADPLAPAAAPVLIVAPGSILENWVREFHKFAPQVKVLKHHGSGRTGRPDELREYDVVVTSYDSVVRDNSMLNMISWTAVICDEAQYIRNPESLRARSVKRLRREAALAVTGTPVENRLQDFWSIVDFVLPGYLGSQQDFQKEYGEDLDSAVRLERFASPVMLRRRVAEVARDLPERIDIPQVIELEESDAAAYDEIRDSIYKEFGASAGLVALTRLRMFCAHPSLLNDPAVAADPADFAKYRRFVEILEEIFAAGEKAIVFVAYTGMTDIMVSDVAARFGVFTASIDGRVAIDDRQPLIDRFSAVHGPALLVLNPRAGGAGLNITAANHVIHYTLEWNPALEDQASARAYRRGQTLPVTVHRLFCAGTVEEVVDDRLTRKRTLSEAAVVGVTGKDDDYKDIVSALTRSPLANRAAP